MAYIFLSLAFSSSSSFEDREKKPVRVYPCNECGGFHLTSSELDKKQQKKIWKSKVAGIRKAAEEWMKRKGWQRDVE